MMGFLSSLSVLIFQGYFCIVAYSSWPSFSLFSGVARETHSLKRWPLVAYTVCAALSGPSGLSLLLLGTMPLFMAHAVPAVNVLRSCTACFSLSAADSYCPAVFLLVLSRVVICANELPPLLFGCVTTSSYPSRLFLILYFLKIFAVFNTYPSTSGSLLWTSIFY